MADPSAASAPRRAGPARQRQVLWPLRPADRTRVARPRRQLAHRRSARAATLLGRPEARHFFAHLSDLGLQRGDLLLELDLALLGLRGDLLRALLSLRGKLARPLVGVLDQGVHFTCPLIEKL